MFSGKLAALLGGDGVLLAAAEMDARHIVLLGDCPYLDLKYCHVSCPRKVSPCQSAIPVTYLRVERGGFYAVADVGRVPTESCWYPNCR